VPRMRYRGFESPLFIFTVTGLIALGYFALTGKSHLPPKATIIVGIVLVVVGLPLLVVALF
jgi:uncharacterized membrane protein YjjP (DUF1212 family)